MSTDQDIILLKSQITTLHQMMLDLHNKVTDIYMRLNNITGSAQITGFELSEIFNQLDTRLTWIESHLEDDLLDDANSSRIDETN